MNRLKAYFDSLTSGQKRRRILALLVLATVGIGMGAYKYSRSSMPSPAAPEGKKEISLEPKMMEKSLLLESQNELKKQQEGMIELRKEIEELKKEREEGPKNERLQNQRRPIEKSAFKNAGIPPPPEGVYPPGPPPPMPSPGPAASAKGPAPEIFGEIAVIENPYAKAVKSGEEEGKKKEKKTVYLPPSFMEATLLTGLDAETVESAKGNPEPVLLRIRDLAVLPNQVKANLRGCFVIAHGFGKLSKERVDLRLVTLSCLTKEGQAVIDQGVKGYVADEDGKNGLRGNVVSRMGAAVARAALAGFFGGAGDAFRAAASTTSISPLGATQTIQPADIGTAAAGGGLAGASHELEKLYLELARQATPIIEVGATKTVTLVVTEGVDLVIKETCVGGQPCEK